MEVLEFEAYQSVNKLKETLFFPSSLSENRLMVLMGNTLSEILLMIEDITNGNIGNVIVELFKSKKQVRIMADDMSTIRRDSLVKTM